MILTEMTTPSSNISGRDWSHAVQLFSISAIDPDGDWAVVDE
jgi:hypothetical protein